MISWLRGAKQDWLASEAVEDAIDKSSTYSKGREIAGHIWTKDEWETVLCQSVNLGYVDICFHTFDLKSKVKLITRTYRNYRLSDEGHSFLENPLPVLVSSPFKNVFGSDSQGIEVKKKKKSEQEEVVIIFQKLKRCYRKVSHGDQ
jgi:hypothetical protein